MLVGVNFLGVAVLDVLSSGSDRSHANSLHPTVGQKLLNMDPCSFSILGVSAGAYWRDKG